MEGWPSRKSPAEDPGDGGPAGQTEEGEEPEAVSAGLLRGCPAKTETKGVLNVLNSYIKLSLKC